MRPLHAVILGALALAAADAAAVTVTPRQLPTAHTTALKGGVWRNCASEVRYPVISGGDDLLTREANAAFKSFADAHACRGKIKAQQGFVAKAQKQHQQMNYRVVSTAPEKIVIEMRHNLHVMKHSHAPIELASRIFTVDYAQGTLRCEDMYARGYERINAKSDIDKGDRLYESGDLPLNNFLRY